MHVHAVAPEVGIGKILAGCQFIDAFSVTVADINLDARRAAERMVGHMPRWARVLLKMRDVLVAPFGIRTATSISAADRIGIFPVVSETPQRLIAGLDDRHLDFRLFVDVAPAGAQLRVTATTVVLTHNRLGRTYLAMVMPFHKLIVRSMLRQIAN